MIRHGIHGLSLWVSYAVNPAFWIVVKLASWSGYPLRGAKYFLVLMFEEWRGAEWYGYSRGFGYGFFLKVGYIE